MNIQSVGEIVRTMEQDFLHGTTQISEYVEYSMWDDLNRIDAYYNSKHLSGEFDSLGREKPFFNISVASTNIWYRATDIDRRHMRIRANKSKDWIGSFLATVHLRDWMRRARFGVYLNDWGRTLAKYGSAVTKKVENSKGLTLSCLDWNSLIVDPVDFNNNPKIELMYLTESQLRERVKTHGYRQDAVESLIASGTQTRQTINSQQVDNKSNYFKVYEVHGVFPLALLTDDESDEDTFVQQMYVMSYVDVKGKKGEYIEYSLYAGQEKGDPYRIDHLIEEKGKTLSTGAVKSLFEAQWMMNHSTKAIKDTLDVTSKLVLQTADENLQGRNVLSELETGDIIFTTLNKPLTPVNMSKGEVQQWQGFMQQWKVLGNEVTGISEAMLGAQAKSGTAWRQTEALLQESYSLFELMTENKALALEDMLREWIIPHIKKSFDTSEEVSAKLEMYEINRIDALWLKKESTRRVNERIAESIFNMQPVTAEQQELAVQEEQNTMRQDMQQFENTRFFKPSEISTKTWKEQFKDLEWNVEIDITGEAFDSKEAMTTLNTALQLVVQPGFEQNKRAQAIVGRILELTNAMSPVEYMSIPQSTPSPISSEAPKVEAGIAGGGENEDIES